MATIRNLFHTLGSKHNLLTVGCGVTKEIMEDCLEDKKLPEGLKSELAKILEYLGRLIKDAKEADKIATEIHDRIYKIIDPDTEKPKES